MLSHRIPAFDLLTEQQLPYTGFGNPLPDSPERLSTLGRAADEARSRVEKGFARTLDAPRLVPGQLDDVIKEMWDHGWSPDEGDINLFVRDFGLVLISAILARFGGKVVARSDEDISHLSVWWAEKRIELFPFHHIAKCLLARDTDSLTSFVNGVSAMVQPNQGSAQR